MSWSKNKSFLSLHFAESQWPTKYCRRCNQHVIWMFSATGINIELIWNSLVLQQDAVWWIENYNATQKTILAVIWTNIFFRPYVEKCQSFLLQTTNRCSGYSIEYILQKASLVGSSALWSFTLQAFIYHAKNILQRTLLLNSCQKGDSKDNNYVSRCSFTDVKHTTTSDTSAYHKPLTVKKIFIETEW